MAEKKPGLISRLFGAKKQKPISVDVTSDSMTSPETEAIKSKRLNRLFSVDATTFRDKDELYNHEFGDPKDKQELQLAAIDEEKKRPSSAGSKKPAVSSTSQQPSKSVRMHTNGEEASEKPHSSKHHQSSSSSKPEPNQDQNTRSMKSTSKANGKDSSANPNLARRKSAGAALSRGSSSSTSGKDPTSPTKSISSKKSLSKSSTRDPTSSSAGSPTKTSTSSTKSPTSPDLTPPVFDDDQPALNSSTKDQPAHDHKSSTSPSKARRSSTKPKISSTRKGSLQGHTRGSDEQPLKSSPPSGTSAPVRLASEGNQRTTKLSKANAAKALRRKKANKASGAGSAGGVQVDVSKPLSFPATPETIYEYHLQKPFLDRNEEWLIVELNEYECLVDSIDIIKIIAKHSKFFEVEPDELWVEFFEFVEEVPSYDEIINYDVWQEFRDEKYPC